MIIKPLRSFTGDPDVADFPDLKLYWDHDDFKSGAINAIVQWKCRVTGNIASIIPAAGDAILKDVDGIYSNDVATAIAVSGTMPTVLSTHYAVVVGLGKAHASSTIVGAAPVIGGATGIKLGGIGLATSVNVAQNTAPTLSPTALTTVNKNICTLAYFDLVDITSPAIYRLVANDDYTAATSQTSGSGTTTSTAVIPPGAIANELGVFVSLAGTPTARQRSVMLFLFTTPKTLDELKLACITMSKTGKPYAGWRR